MSILASFIVPHPPLIIPEVGKGREKDIEKTIESYEKVAKEISELNPDTIIISSPHAPFYADGFWIYNLRKIHGDLNEFGADSVSFLEEIDLDLVQEIDNIAKKSNFPVACSTFKEDLDHATIVPLYFIRKYLKKCKIIVVGLSSLPLIDHYKLGMIIKDAVENLNKRVVFVASGDLSHKLQEYGPYGFCEYGPIYDKNIVNDCSKGAFYNLLEYKSSFLDSAAECGHRSFTIMAGLWDGFYIKSNYYSHEDITGVGYGVFSFYPINKNNDRKYFELYLNNNKGSMPKSPYTKLAYMAIDYYIKCNKYINVPDNIESELLENRAGVFVSIHKFDTLRGCIGTTSPIYNTIAEEIIHNAVSAAFGDPRFTPIIDEELPFLDISVDVLSKPQDISSLDELNPKIYGIIVYNNKKSGLLLPDLEGINDINTQIDIAKQKAGIYDENYKIKRFTVTRYY